jgi:hypothetical protein
MSALCQPALTLLITDKHALALEGMGKVGQPALLRRGCRVASYREEATLVVVLVVVVSVEVIVVVAVSSSSSSSSSNSSSCFGDSNSSVCGVGRLSVV